MIDARGAAATVLTNVADTEARLTTMSLATAVGRGALFGGLAGVAIAVPLAWAEGSLVFVATAFDIAAGLALIGGLIAANIASTD